MPRYFTHYWARRTFERECAASGGLAHTAGNLFSSRGVRPGDVVFVVSAFSQQVYLAGAMDVGFLGSQEEAAVALGTTPLDLWDADEHLLAARCTPCGATVVPRSVVEQLRFEPDGKPLKFRPSGEVDQQTLRGVRQLQPLWGQELLAILPPLEANPYTSPEECPETYSEGPPIRVAVNRYERNAKARQACLTHHGVRCCVCGLRFEDMYGDRGLGFMHVHHCTPVSSSERQLTVDPIHDLRPVCPNCHAMLHRSTPPLSVDDLRSLITFRWPDTRQQ